MTRTLEFVVNGQRLTKDPNSNFSGLVSGSKGYLTCRFEFSEEWKNLKKAVQFKIGDNPIYKPLIGNECKIPDEVTDSTRIHIAVIGKGSSTYLTTNAAVIMQRKGVR